MHVQKSKNELNETEIRESMNFSKCYFNCESESKYLFEQVAINKSYDVVKYDQYLQFLLNDFSNVKNVKMSEDDHQFKPCIVFNQSDPFKIGKKLWR